MTTYSFPSSPVPSGISFQLISNTQAFTSPLNNTTQTVELAGARWAATLTFSNLTEEVARPFIAFLTTLRGGANRVRLYDHSYQSSQGAATGFPIVLGGDQTGNTLATSGWTPSVTNILKAGDFVTFGDELKIITADVNSNGSGQATITFEPPIRNSPTDSSSITVTNPTAVMRLVDDSQTAWTVGRSKVFNITLSFIESFT